MFSRRSLHEFSNVYLRDNDLQKLEKSIYLFNENFLEKIFEKNLKIDFFKFIIYLDFYRLKFCCF